MLYVKINYPHLIILLAVTFYYGRGIALQNDQKKTAKPAIQKKIVYFGCAVSALAFLYWLVQQKNVQNVPSKNLKLNNSKNNPHSRENKMILTETTQEQHRIQKEKYNKEIRMVVDDLLWCLNFSVDGQSLREILASCHDEVNETYLFGLKVPFDSLTDDRKILMYCCMFHFNQQSKEYCHKIAGITRETFPADFDFYNNRSEWQLPTYDELFAHIQLKYFQGTVCSERAAWDSFSITQVAQVNDFLLGLQDGCKKESINGVMCAIYISLKYDEHDIVRSVYEPRLKELLALRYHLTDNYWLKKICSGVGDPVDGTKTMEKLEAIIEVLDCFYPTEFLLSEPVLALFDPYYDGNNFASICRSIYERFRNIFNKWASSLNLTFKLTNGDSLNFLLFIVYTVGSAGREQVIFDRLFTKENLEEDIFKKFLKEEGIANADVIWRFLKAKDKCAQNLILDCLGAISQDLKETILFFQRCDSCRHELDSAGNPGGITEAFFTLSGRFTQLFYELMQEKNDFARHIMGEGFWGKLFDLSKNSFLDFVKSKFSKNDEELLGYVYHSRNDVSFLHKTAPGTMIFEKEYHKNPHSEEQKNFVLKYCATRENTLLFLRWYNICHAINLYKDNSCPEHYHNKKYLAHVFKKNLTFYNVDQKKLSNFEADMKESVGFEDGNDNVIDVASMYHILSNLQNEDVYVENNFLSANKELIEKNRMCTFIAKEIFDLPSE